MNSGEWGYVDYGAMIIIGILIGSAYPEYSDFFEKYETLLIGFGGGAAVLVQLRSNERNRREDLDASEMQRLREEASEDEKIRENKRAISACFFAEINDIYIRVKKTVAVIEKNKATPVVCNLNTDIYDTFKDEIGILDSKAAYALIRVYQTIPMLDEAFKNMIKAANNGELKEINTGFNDLEEKSDINLEWADAARKHLALSANLMDQVASVDTVTEKFISEL